MGAEFMITDTDDGSGDAILTFPDGFCEKMGWDVGDDLMLSVTDGKLHIRKPEKYEKSLSGSMKSQKKTKKR